ncbi:MAG: hypothetical protein LBI03_07425 [Clostridiales bacterium]|jgi:hypothetical protein|nr:hypothetical protein [Clostridiales bacterium]
MSINILKEYNYKQTTVFYLTDSMSRKVGLVLLPSVKKEYFHLSENRNKPGLIFRHVLTVHETENVIISCFPVHQ